MKTLKTFLAPIIMLAIVYISAVFVANINYVVLFGSIDLEFQWGLGPLLTSLLMVIVTLLVMLVSILCCYVLYMAWFHKNDWEDE